MDDRIYPGLTETKESIIKEVTRFLNVKEVVGRKGDVVGCKKLIIFLLQEFYTDWTLTEYGSPVGVDHTVVLHYRRAFSEKYYKKESFYNFLLLNLKAKISGWESFEMKGVYAEIIEKMPVSKDEKRKAKDILNYKMEAHKINNTIVRVFVVYLIREELSPREISSLMGISNKAPLKGIDLPDKYKHSYLSVVESVIKDKITFLKSQEISKNDDNNEKGKTNNPKTKNT